MNHPRRAFTIVELLVTIAIIAVLIGILVPVVSAVRKAAYVASSRNNIQLIATTFERYNTDHQAYPGYFSNQQITAGVAGLANLTMSENAVLSLCGGLTNNPSWGYTATDLGKGPLNFSAVPKRRAAYLDVSNKILSVPGSDMDPSVNLGSAVPEFIDAFPQAMPIIYLRARVSAAGVAPASPGGDTMQYNPAHMKPYFDPYLASYPATPPNGINTTDFPANGVLSAGVESYFGSASLSTATLEVPKNKDTFLLISPGEDRKYGTSDDICNFTF